MNSLNGFLTFRRYERSPLSSKRAKSESKYSENCFSGNEVFNTRRTGKKKQLSLMMKWISFDYQQFNKLTIADMNQVQNVIKFLNELEEDLNLQKEENNISHVQYDKQKLNLQAKKYKVNLIKEKICQKFVQKQQQWQKKLQNSKFGLMNKTKIKKQPNKKVQDQDQFINVQGSQNTYPLHNKNNQNNYKSILKNHKFQVKKQKTLNKKLKLLRYTSQVRKHSNKNFAELRNLSLKNYQLESSSIFLNELTNRVSTLDSQKKMNRGSQLSFAFEPRRKHKSNIKKCSIKPKYGNLINLYVNNQQQNKSKFDEYEEKQELKQDEEQEEETKKVDQQSIQRGRKIRKTQRINLEEEINMINMSIEGKQINDEHRSTLRKKRKYFDEVTIKGKKMKKERIIRNKSWRTSGNNSDKKKKKKQHKQQLEEKQLVFIMKAINRKQQTKRSQFCRQNKKKRGDRNSWLKRKTDEISLQPQKNEENRHNPSSVCGKKKSIQNQWKNERIFSQLTQLRENFQQFYEERISVENRTSFCSILWNSNRKSKQLQIYDLNHAQNQLIIKHETCQLPVELKDNSFKEQNYKLEFTKKLCQNLVRLGQK